ncbi:expressed protein [Batrachochytrium dendrobatidis JAM81]|uniref:Expressed protein n=2 Tax=Batrachochytrium dendrobatidis TaxID=109871 RepID=F4P3R5_BATDJ|nr:uncharacterized protein BATDEDRAFT_35077 [Batrachochytrium dendrobatidis JAM81]EGF80130.1 expressed protein [Batrachochytrium dendrobatidis JAM81]KAJ8326601.1 hypothetical protein O5D80_005334 [Batrachochytrium dendrobatidis]KAK5666616.1 hypothetical protein QVD99_006686 [Batrachochytrium dendrobatidis]OAJ41246.1 hypothetical protein BDEG_24878 [Batrachochytrium dendrobatidis JEL423]|eukprot:XP_006679099.1 expressed protein [Batrachochytrium dendrobatidis JAM81]
MRFSTLQSLGEHFDTLMDTFQSQLIRTAIQSLASIYPTFASQIESAASSLSAEQLLELQSLLVNVQLRAQSTSSGEQPSLLIQHQDGLAAPTIDTHFSNQSNFQYQSTHPQCTIQHLLHSQPHLPLSSLTSTLPNTTHVNEDPLAELFTQKSQAYDSFNSCKPIPTSLVNAPKPCYDNGVNHSPFQEALFLATQPESTILPYTSPNLASDQAPVHPLSFDNYQPCINDKTTHLHPDDHLDSSDLGDLDDLENETCEPPALRQSYTNGQKLKLIQDVEIVGVKEAIRLAGLDVHPSMVYRWMRTKNKLEQHRSTARKSGSGRRPALSLEYEQAIVAWIQEQQSHKFEITFSTVRKYARSLMPPGTGMKLSTGWFMGFCRRNNIGQLCESSS